MKVCGEAILDAPATQVWDALLAPEVLVRTIPGCERLELTKENTYAMTVTAGVASIKGSYRGTCELRDLKPHSSLLMKAQGSGAGGTIGVDVDVHFEDLGDGTTRLSYAADAVVGGMIGGVGQRMLTSVSKRMAGEFFGAVNNILTGAAPEIAAVPLGGLGSTTGAPPSAATVGQTFTAPVKTGAGGGTDFLTGVGVGAALVLLGVLAGALAGRRRG